MRRALSMARRKPRQTRRSIGPDMSAIPPISFLVTLLCVLVAINWALYQQVLFVGAALLATVWVCSLEASSRREAPARREDASSGRHRASE